HSLTVYELSGNAIFNMSLDGNRDVSDMLYIKNADGEYTVNVIDAVTQADMYADGFNGLRFATVGAGSNARFRAITYNGGGINNVEYTVDTDSYDGNAENDDYNGSNTSEHKPGSDLVDGFFGSNDEPGAQAAAKVMALAAEENNGTLDETTNFKLVGVSSSEISDAGKTVIDMSRANYANAVYMDTLNKRQGEARFVGNTDHGVWVRLRHDNIGKDDSFRTHNTMVEIGFDQRDLHDYGEFHTGFAIDYMNGSIDYHTVDGDGDIERYGLWFYTTYLGKDGQYADLVLKYGHLKNDFDFNMSGTGVKVDGDYSNEVASLSAEYGWKFSNSYNYYIEPQAQLQYSYVTSADYTTSYGTKVDLDSIHSLIGRIGFRAGKDFATETPVTLYARADVLHEFLGDQDIYAYDDTGVMDVTYENDDTWYSAGLGISVQSSENTYFFLEGEQVFGADNDSTYTVSGGFKHSF
ncbi:autotransporter outer membrane beta-barrel domain-containing protein, partial [Succinatimonas hippei]|uniref:autotransporter outer membrane beta-barrel domain-containing protein n=1 Tax=Succinatimonas hippei TaxID=626938 RepID=UPI0023F99BCD